MDVSDCPTDRQLVALLEGDLPASDFEALAAHTEGCPGCQSRLERLEDVAQAFVDPLRAGIALAQYKQEPQLQQVLARLNEDKNRAAGGHAGTKQASLLDLPANGMLGDYRLLREIGRGGMGVVYLAEQISLNRRVALKILPFAAVLDPRQRTRFKNEAQAAAGLQHQNIVPVYAVGCERGVHFYAMQYVDGQSLAELIRQLRQSAKPEAVDGSQEDFEVVSAAQPITDVAETRSNAGAPTNQSHGDSVFLRTAVELGIAAAEALNYAHEQGIVHRDVKPSNLMLDAEGKLWVTDFGLARFEADAGLTASGDLLGTPRYMSPEQALARRGIVDHRTDVYSLGATIYELLTLEPIFPGNDRREILHSIANEEPRPPKLLNQAIPTDLETIVLKAISKSAVDRYETAGALADDLRCFLEDRPIRAKRPSLVDRSAKWSRRHRSLFAAGVVFLVLLSIGMTVSSVMIWQEQQRTEQALIQSHDNYEMAEANFRRATEAVDEMLTEVAGSELAGVPHMGPIRRSLLEKALVFYQEFLEQKGSDPAIRFETGRAHRRVSEIHRLLGQIEPAEEAAQDSIEILRELSSEFRDVPEYRQALADSLRGLSGALFQLRPRRVPEATAAVQEALQIRHQLVIDFPDVLQYRRELAREQVLLGHNLNSSQRYDEAEINFRQALAVWERLQADFPDVSVDAELADVHHWLGGVLEQDLERRDEARSELEIALDFLRGLPPEELATPAHQTRLAHVTAYLAGSYQHAGEGEKSAEMFRRAIEIREKLVADFPSSHEHARRLALCYSYLARVLWLQVRFDEAEVALRRSLEIREPMAAEFSDVRSHTNGVAWLHYDLGVIYRETGRLAESAAEFRITRDYLEEVVSREPDLAMRVEQLAFLLTNAPVPELRDPQRALRLAKHAVELAPERDEYRVTLAGAHYHSGDYQACCEVLESFLPSSSDDAQQGYFLLAMARWQLGQKQQALECYRQGVDWMDGINPYHDDMLEFRRLRRIAAKLLQVTEPGEDQAADASGAGETGARQPKLR